MKIAPPLCLTVLLAVAPALADTAADRFAPKRGVNLDLWLTWPSVADMVARPEVLAVFPEWRRHVPPGALAGLAAAGFDHVRLAIDPAPFLRLGPGAAETALVGQVVETTGLLHESGLKVIVDLHSIPRGDAPVGTFDLLAEAALFDAYVAMTGRMAAALGGLDPDRTALELMNEPTNDCGLVFEPDRQQWPGQLARLHQAARDAAPDLPLVATGGCWGSADGLVAMDPGLLADDNVIWTFHSYGPFFFTHQGAGWTDGAVVQFAAVPFPPSAIDDAMADRLVSEAVARATAGGRPDMTEAILRAELQAYRDLPAGDATEDIARVAAWADAHDLPRHRVYLGEFGVILSNHQGIAVPPASRAAFLDAKISAVEAAGFGWAVASWTGSLAIADDKTYAPLPALCPALRLTGC